MSVGSSAGQLNVCEFATSSMAGGNVIELMAMSNLKIECPLLN